MDGFQAELSLPTLPVESPEFWANPEPFVAEARKHHPWLARYDQGYFVHGYKASKELLQADEHLYVGLEAIVDFYGLHDSMWGRFMKEMLNSKRGAEHARIRNAVAAGFTPRHANHIRPLMRRTITELLDAWAPKGAFDFAEFASNFPIAVMCGLLGVSAEPVPRLRHALEAQIAGLTLNKDTQPDFLGGFDTMWDFVDGLILEREASGAADPDSLLDGMIAAKTSGGLDETELRFLIMLLLFAGYDTSKNMLSMIMHLLIERPEMYRRCAEDRSYCTKVIEEALRHSSITTNFRQVMTSFEYEGFRFPEGAMVMISAAMAGRDPTVYSDPLLFDPERKPEERHIAFGRGEHICIGQFLARIQLEEGLHLIAQRLRNPRLDGEVTWRPFMPICGPRTLPIAFDQAEAWRPFAGAPPFADQTNTTQSDVTAVGAMCARPSRSPVLSVSTAWSDTVATV